jgi:perosamine synthetase
VRADGGWPRATRKLLADLDGVTSVSDPEYGEANFQSFWVLFGPEYGVGRDEVLAELAANGISARRGIMAAHLEPAYADVTPAPLPRDRAADPDSLILPMHHLMSDEDQDYGRLRPAQDRR